MSNTVEILQIDTEKELQGIISRLSKYPDMIAAPDILKKAINTASRRTQTRLKKGVLRRYKVTDTSILKDTSQGAPKVVSATTSNLTGTIYSAGPMTEIMKFLTLPNSKTTASAAQVLNSGSLKMLETGGRKAFATQFKSGHIAIVQREGDDRLPVKKILSPAVPHMLGNDEVREYAEPYALDYIQAEIERMIAKANLK